MLSPKVNVDAYRDHDKIYHTCRAQKLMSMHTDTMMIIMVPWNTRNGNGGRPHEQGQHISGLASPQTQTPVLFSPRIVLHCRKAGTHRAAP